MSKKKQRKKLKKQIKKRGLTKARAVVICVGKKCCDRERSRELVRVARNHAEASHPEVEIVKVGCLDICKKGPIVGTYPEIRIHKRVDSEEVRALVDKVAG